MKPVKMNPHDVRWIGERLPNNVADLILKDKRIFLAGGFIRSCITNEPISDIDLFAPSAEVAKKAALILAKHNDENLWHTDNAITVKNLQYPVQFIHRWTFDSPEEAMKSFDFTIAMAAIFIDSNDRICGLVHPDYYSDLAAKRLIYTSPEREEEAGGSLLRILKFYQRGYRIPLDSLSAVIMRLLAGVKQEQWDRRPDMEYKEWLESTGIIVQSLLYEVDPATVRSYLPGTHKRNR